MTDTAQERFDAKYEINANGCWIWQGFLDRDGYGQFWINGKCAAAHRAAYELHVGPIANELEIDHLCRVRNCVNWRHLEAVSHLENMRRGGWANTGIVAGARTAAKTHCPQSHPYQGENLYIHPTTGGRRCREYANARQRAYRKIQRDTRAQHE